MRPGFYFFVVVPSESERVYVWRESMLGLVYCVCVCVGRAQSFVLSGVPSFWSFVIYFSGPPLLSAPIGNHKLVVGWNLLCFSERDVCNSE